MELFADGTALTNLSYGLFPTTATPGVATTSTLAPLALFEYAPILPATYPVVAAYLSVPWAAGTTTTGTGGATTFTGATLAAVAAALAATLTALAAAVGLAATTGLAAAAGLGAAIALSSET